MISYLSTILSFWSCALASKTYKYLSIYLGRYLYNSAKYLIFFKKKMMPKQVWETITFSRKHKNVISLDLLQILVESRNFINQNIIWKLKLQSLPSINTLDWCFLERANGSIMVFFNAICLIKILCLDDETSTVTPPIWDIRET
jgi:hypothetical protein